MNDYYIFIIYTLEMYDIVNICQSNLMDLDWDEKFMEITMNTSLFEISDMMVVESVIRPNKRSFLLYSFT
jgi:hypothetical protein